MVPGTEYMYCPACGEEIYSHFRAPITSRTSIPSYGYASDKEAKAALNMSVMGMIDAAAKMHALAVAEPAEEAAHAHFSERHRFRYWLWQKTGWDRVLRKWLR